MRIPRVRVDGTRLAIQAGVLANSRPAPAAPAWDDEAVLDFFQTSSQSILAAEAAAGVGHHVALSIVGTDRLPDSGYFRANLAQEEAVKAATVLGRRARARKDGHHHVPTVRTFIERNPEYADLIDPEHPGVTKGLLRQKGVTMTINLEAEAATREENNVALIAALDKVVSAR